MAGGQATKGPGLITISPAPSPEKRAPGFGGGIFFWGGGTKKPPTHANKWRREERPPRPPPKPATLLTLQKVTRGVLSACPPARGKKSFGKFSLLSHVLWNRRELVPLQRMLKETPEPRLYGNFFFPHRGESEKGEGKKV